MQVLLLATDPVSRRALEVPLAAAGHAVLTLDDPAQVLAAMHTHDARLAVLPARLYPGTGAQICERIKDGAAFRGARVVIYGPDPADAQGARAASADGFVQIPFAPAELLAEVGRLTRERKLVLLADDSHLIHKQLVPSLQEASYDVVEAYDGVEAVRLAGTRRPDVVVTDIEMPRQDGYGVCRALKSDPALRAVPVLIVSSKGEGRDIEQGFEAGADDYLVKPVAPDELLSRIETILGGIEMRGREHILVVDDSPLVRNLVVQALTRQGFEVSTANDGAEGLERATALGPDLIISDYDMPRMNGFELAHALKRDERTRKVPVMMLTARDTTTDRAKTRAVGVSAYLVKPFNIEKCVVTVERILAEKRLRAEQDAMRFYLSAGAMEAARRHARRRKAGGPALLAEDRTMTILFSDIVGFTNRSARTPPPKVVEMLNAFFDEMCPVIARRGGSIDKFIGDAIMALFDEGDAGDGPLRAVAAALEMQAAASAFNQKHGGDPVLIRVGLNTGNVVFGEIGSKYIRRDFTVIGDAVNRAQRMESNAPHSGVLVSEETYARVRDCVEVEPVEVKLKGIEGGVRAYVVQRITAELPS